MLQKGKGRKQGSALNSPESNATNGVETDEAIPADEEPLDPFDQQVEQIFDLASICKTMAEDLYPIPDDCTTEMYLVLLKIQADCHMELFRAIVNNATNMVQAMQSLAAQGPVAPGIVLARAGESTGFVLRRPPGGR